MKNNSKPTDLSPYYLILGIAETAGPEEIKTAYRALCKTWHPDIRDGESTGKMALINEAYYMLRGQITEVDHEPVPPGDRAYEFYKKGLDYFNKCDLNMSSGPNHLTLNRKRMFDKNRSLDQLEQTLLKSLYYFNMICVHFDKSVWYEDSVEKVSILNRRRLIINRWRG